MSLYLAYLTTFSVHLILLISFFQIKFPPYELDEIEPECAKGEGEPMTDRVVLFLVDGLGAKSFLNAVNRGPRDGRDGSFFREVAREEGSWSTVVTVFPSISSVRSASILTGYNQPTGDKVGKLFRPVYSADSVLSYVNHLFYVSCPWEPGVVSTFCDLNPDSCTILLLGEKFYKESSNGTDIDVKILKLFEGMFKSKNKTMESVLRSRKSIFYVHLCGHDRLAHIEGPFSENIFDYVSFLDKRIKEISLYLNQYFNDSRTSFVLTADHGMTVQGTHGDETPCSKYVPGLAWGSGIRRQGRTGPLTTEENLHDFEWGSDDYMNQTDWAPLMSALLGVPTPVHSTGILRGSFLNFTGYSGVRPYLCNTLQLLSLSSNFLGKVESEVVPLMPKPPLSKRESESFKEQLLKKFDSGNDTEILHDALFYRTLALSSVWYSQTYFRNVIMIPMMMSYIAWVLYLVQKSIIALTPEAETPKEQKQSLTHKTMLFIPDIIMAIWIVMCALVVSLNKWPLMVCFYNVLTPLLLWLNVHTFRTQGRSIKSAFSSSNVFEIAFMGMGFFVLLCVPLMTMDFYCYAIVLFGLSLTLVTTSMDFWKSPAGIQVLWAISNFGMLGYLLFYYVYNNEMVKSPQLRSLSTTIFIVTTLLYFYFSKMTLKDFGVLAALLFMNEIARWAAISVFAANTDFYKTELGYVKISWIITLLAPLLIIFFGSETMMTYLVQVLVSCSVPMTLMGVQSEGLGYSLFCTMLVTWVVIESPDQSRVNQLKRGEPFEPAQRKILGTKEIRSGLIFFSYLFMTYFTMGSRDSLVGYEFEWYRLYVLSFNKPLMTLLSLYKCMLPVIAVTTAFFVLCKALNVGFKNVFFWVVLLCNTAGISSLKNAGIRVTPYNSPMLLLWHVFSNLLPLMMVITLVLAEAVYEDYAKALLKALLMLRNAYVGCLSKFSDGFARKLNSWTAETPTGDARAKPNEVTL